MESVKDILQRVKLNIAEQVINSEESAIGQLRDAYKDLKAIENILESEDKKIDLIDIPKLPKGEVHNPYPRMMYAVICELYSRDKYFTISDLVELTGASRNQVRTDLKRLTSEKWIELENGYTAERSTHYYKYKPLKLKK